MLVTITGGYLRGWNNLAKDIRSQMKKDDLKKLIDYPDFSIRFTITKERNIINVTFSPVVSDEIRDLVLRALTLTRKWRCGMINGKPINSEISITKDKIISGLRPTGDGSHTQFSE